VATWIELEEYVMNRQYVVKLELEQLKLIGGIT
jgi:hypothetical protein